MKLHSQCIIPEAEEQQIGELCKWKATSCFILVANPFQHIFHLANNRLGGHNLNLTSKAKYPAKELWADSNRDFYFKMLIINLTPAHTSNVAKTLPTAFTMSAYPS